jgi:hypothetical protein
MKRTDWLKRRRIGVYNQLDALKREISAIPASKVLTPEQVRKVFRETRQERRRQDGGVWKNGHRSCVGLSD